MVRSMLVSGSAVVMAAGLSVAAGQVAASAAPAVPKVVEEVDVTFPAGYACPFEMRIVGTSGQQERGPGNVTGPFALTVTNVETGTSATYNASGPLAQGKSVGTWLLFQPVDNESGAPPFVYVTAGNPSFNADGTLASLRGTVLHDVCAELS